jgi:hypothetical protein
MNTNFKLHDKVKYLRRGENGGNFVETGRGIVLGVAEGKNSQWIKFFDTDLWTSFDCAEWVSTNSNRSKVVKWL